MMKNISAILMDMKGKTMMIDKEKVLLNMMEGFKNIINNTKDEQLIKDATNEYNKVLEEYNKLRKEK